MGVWVVFYLSALREGTEKQPKRVGRPGGSRTDLIQKVEKSA